jgi:hypothetical protein
MNTYLPACRLGWGPDVKGNPPQLATVTHFPHFSRSISGNIVAWRGDGGGRGWPAGSARAWRPGILRNGLVAGNVRLDEKAENHADKNKAFPRNADVNHEGVKHETVLWGVEMHPSPLNTAQLAGPQDEGARRPRFHSAAG